MAVTRIPQWLGTIDYPQSIINSHQVILVINAKSIAKVPEDLGTILLELEMTGQIFPGIGVFKVRKQSNNITLHLYRARQFTKHLHIYYLI